MTTHNGILLRVVTLRIKHLFCFQPVIMMQSGTLTCEQCGLSTKLERRRT
jgi:hypothetical protein